MRRTIICDCFDEIIPIANNYGDEHLTNLGIIGGFMIMMMVGLSLLDYPMFINLKARASLAASTKAKLFLKVLHKF